MSEETEDFERPLSAREDDEGLFGRDDNGQLVRRDTPAEADYEKMVTLKIDNEEVEIPLAERLKDAQGNIVQDINGRTTPRYTTIYDAVVKLYTDKERDLAQIPIPTLCHQPHMTPVAVCRLCVVQICAMKRGKVTAERKLLPACQHQVKEGMEVYTMNDPSKYGDGVRQAVKVLTELLVADHLKPAPAPAPAEELAPFNELQKLANQILAEKVPADKIPAGPLKVADSRFKIEALWKTAPATPAPPPRAKRVLDRSSIVFIVDHTACILCQRCSRACGEVKDNNVIGSTGKGPTAGISFDLNDEMGDSTCVQCGECMVSCPTSAITFKPVAKVKVPTRD